MRYARCKFSSSLVHKKNFRFIWQVVFKLGDVKRGRIPLLSLNELWEKSQATTILGKFVKSHNQTLIGLQFSGMLFIGQNLNRVHMTYHILFLNFWSSFEILFWLTQVHIYCLEFISHYITEILYLNTNSNRNQSWNENKHFHLFLSWNKNKHFHLFLYYKAKNSLWTIFIFFQFHIFRSSHSQMFFKIGAFKDFAILWIKNRLQQTCFLRTY